MYNEVWYDYDKWLETFQQVLTCAQQIFYTDLSIFKLYPANSTPYVKCTDYSMK